MPILEYLNLKLPSSNIKYARSFLSIIQKGKKNNFIEPYARCDARFLGQSKRVCCIRNKNYKLIYSYEENRFQFTGFISLLNIILIPISCLTISLTGLYKNEKKNNEIYSIIYSKSLIVFGLTLSLFFILNLFFGVFGTLAPPDPFPPLSSTHIAYTYIYILTIIWKPIFYM